MSPPWMPLYIADYLADTGELSTIEHGAYLLLIMNYWQKGGLPTEDAKLAHITRLSMARWLKVKPTLSRFFTVFGQEIRHKRIDAELAHAAAISLKRRAAAQAKAGANAGANDVHLHTHARASSPSPSKKDSEAYASAAHAALEPSLVEVPEPVDEDPKAKLFRIGKTILVSFGIAEKRTGSLLGQWLKARKDPAGLLAAIQYARDQSVAEPIAYITTLISNAKARNGQFGKQSLSDRAFQLADEFEAEERARGVERPPDRH